MADQKNSPSDDHIEDLLSQLQGIFGRLSSSEEEESQTKIDPPPVNKPVSSAPPSVPAESQPTQDPAFEAPTPVPLSVPAPSTPNSAPAAITVSAELPPVAPTPLPTSSESPDVPTAPMSMPPADTLAPSNSDLPVVNCAIFFPPNHEAEVKTLTERVETMTPKFTKVSFQIKVSALFSYDPKGEIRDSVVSRLEQGIQAVFLVVERTIEESKRKAIAGELDPRGIYFQEVPVASVEKKAFYTDLLLGMVFFYDSLKDSQR